jgi:superfamily II DNA or RNA helicase
MIASPPRIPRPYQTQCLDSVIYWEQQGFHEQLVILPTGTGKTFCASSLPEAIGMLPWQTLLFLVGTEELAFQAVEDLQEANPGLRVSLEKAEYSADVDADLIVASMQTLARSPERLAKLAALPLRVVFVDEADTWVARDPMKVLHGLRVLKGEDNRDESILLVGLTATPRRHSGEALECLFSKIAYRKSIMEMVAAGWVAEPVIYRVDTGIDLDSISVKKNSGGRDYDEKELANTVNTPRLNALVVKKYLEYGAGLPTIAFTVNIEHSEELARTFRHHGIDFEPISSNTPKAKRKELVEAHRNGDLTGLASCQALLVGFNSPRATVSLFVRPTLSGRLYTQAVGRTGRPFPAPEQRATHTGYVKRNNIIVDFVGNSQRNRLYTGSTLFGLNPQFDMEGRPVREVLAEIEELQKQNPTLDVTQFTSLEAIEASVHSVDAWKPPTIPKLAKSCSSFIWTQDRENVYRLSAPGLTVFIEHNHLGQYEVYRQQDKTEDVRQIFSEPEDSFAFADSLIPDEVVVLMKAKSRWRKEPPSENQCQHLYWKDPVIRNRFRDGQAFYRFACHQFATLGNSAFSKGNLSLRIDMLKRAKEKGATK